MKRTVFFLAALALAACRGIDSPDNIDSAGTPLPPAEDLWNIPSVDPGPDCGLPGSSSIVAGFDDTRSSLEAKENGGARVIWSPGDTFQSYQFTEANTYYKLSFTTAEGGASAVFTAPYSLNDGKIYSFYPPVTSGIGQTSDKLPLFNLFLPIRQNAVPGSVEDGVNLAYAYSEVFTSKLLFHNVPALIRFRLSGELTSQVSSITVKGNGNIAGHFVVSPNGEALRSTGYYFSQNERSSSVVLNGPFEPGVDYYIAIIPGTRRIRIVASDEGGENTSSFTAGKDIEFKQGRITDIGTLELGSAFKDEKPIDPVLYMEASAGAKPVSIAVIPEGFTEDQLDDYTMLAGSAIDALFNTEPYKSYREYFNVWLLYARSYEAGASVTDGNGNITDRHDTAFEARWGASTYGDMAANEDLVYNFVSEICPDIKNGIHSINEVPILMIINDTRYGGICHSNSQGKGYGMVPYARDGGGLRWSYPSDTAVSETDPSQGTRSTTQEERNEMGTFTGDWRNVAIHEFGGHCFGRLGDEYWSGSTGKDAVSFISTHYWSVPFGENISAFADEVPWQTEILNHLEELQSVDSRYGRTGIFQGGDYSPLNRWRSEKISCMIDNRAYFSTWQRALIVKRIMTLSGGSFSLGEFFAKDNPYDPVRDGTSSYAPGGIDPATVRLVPPLPPPVLTD